MLTHADVCPCCSNAKEFEQYQILLKLLRITTGLLVSVQRNRNKNAHGIQKFGGQPPAIDFVQVSPAIINVKKREKKKQKQKCSRNSKVWRSEAPQL